MKLKKITIKIRNRLAARATKILYFTVKGKRIFLNKYTNQIPVLSSVISFADGRLVSARTSRVRNDEYAVWFHKNYPGQAKLQRQKAEQEKFKIRPLISVLLPTYNTDPSHLKECINSVLVQTYNNWELCIADDASTIQSTREIIKKYAKQDSRIKYVFRKKNGHICEATNSSLNIASGKYVALLDHDDVLWPNALYEVVTAINKRPDIKLLYTDEDKIKEDSDEHTDPFFKPDWSPELLRSINYITHFAVLDRKLAKEVGGFRKGYEGAQDWDLFLRVSDNLKYVHHIPTVLYSWRMSKNSTATKPSAKYYAYANQKKVLEDDVRRRGLVANIKWQIPYLMWRADYKSQTKPLVSIVIPTKDQFKLIKQCLSSIKAKTDYKNMEIVIVDTGSEDKKVWELYKKYQKLFKAIKIVKWDEKPFNFSAACNFGAKNSSGEYLLFLNNDTQVISSSWVDDMLGYAQQRDIGAVGAKLYYPDGRIQHAGVILGVGGQNGTPGIAGHFFPAFIDNPPQDPKMDLYAGGARNFTAVTAACLMVSKKNFNKVNGFDPAFQIAFNDVDFCLKLYSSGLRNVYLPHVRLYHHESVSVGQPGSKQRDEGVFAKEIKMMIKKWGPIIKNDPFYHPEFRKDVASARLKMD